MATPTSINDETPQKREILRVFVLHDLESQQLQSRSHSSLDIFQSVTLAVGKRENREIRKIRKKIYVNF